MGISKLLPILAELPYGLSEQVRSYTESVQGSIYEIFAEAKVPHNIILEERLLFFAGIRKLYSLVSSANWSLDNSSTLLAESNVNRIKIGATDVGPDSAYAQQLNNLMHDLDRTFDRLSLGEYLHGSYSDIIKRMTTNDGFI